MKPTAHCTLTVHSLLEDSLVETNSHSAVLEPTHTVTGRKYMFGLALQKNAADDDHGVRGWRQVGRSMRIQSLNIPLRYSQWSDKREKSVELNNPSLMVEECGRCEEAAQSIISCINSRCIVDLHTGKLTRLFCASGPGPTDNSPNSSAS